MSKLPKEQNKTKKTRFARRKRTDSFPTLCSPARARQLTGRSLRPGPVSGARAAILKLSSKEEESPSLNSGLFFFIVVVVGGGGFVCV